jgi:hypothetical protein
MNIERRDMINEIQAKFRLGRDNSWFVVIAILFAASGCQRGNGNTGLTPKATKQPQTDSKLMTQAVNSNRETPPMELTLEALRSKIPPSDSKD